MISKYSPRPLWAVSFERPLVVQICVQCNEVISILIINLYQGHEMYCS